MFWNSKDYDENKVGQNTQKTQNSKVLAGRINKFLSYIGYRDLK